MDTPPVTIVKLDWGRSKLRNPESFQVRYCDLDLRIVSSHWTFVARHLLVTLISYRSLYYVFLGNIMIL